MTYVYDWMGIVGAIGAFIAAFGLGANDVSNSFSTTIGSKTLPMSKALMLAVPAEFLGAILFGNRLVHTISSDFVDLSCFSNHLDILAYGMLIVLWVSAVWLVVCTKYGMPVSSTQAVIGALLGIGLSFGGKDCIHWKIVTNSITAESFYNLSGVILTMICWLVSPILAGVLSASLFWLLRRLVLRTDRCLPRSVYVISVVIFLVGLMDTRFLIFQIEAHHLHRTLLPVERWMYSILGGAVVGAVTFCSFYRLRYRIERMDDNVGVDGSCRPCEHPHEPKPNAALKQMQRKIRKSAALKYLAKELAKDMHKEAFNTSELVRGIHDSAEIFDQNVEEIFKPALVITSILFAFSHGAHAAPNVLGPLATLFATYRGSVNTDAIIDDVLNASYIKLWMLFMCGCGICSGLLLFGYSIMSALGLKMAKITPTRGAVITFSAYAVLAFFNRVTIPISSTFCQVCSTFGVALLEGQKGVNWGVLMKVLFGFLFTTFCCCGLAALIFSQGIYCPSFYEVLS
eukprot:266800_1